jgi:hypothetical protein
MYAEHAPQEPMLRNQPARRQHAKETWLQIVLPVALVGALLVSLVLLATSTGASVEAVSQVSTMLLAGLLMVMGLIFLVLLVVGILALAQAMHWLPPQAFRAQRAIQKVNSRAKRISDVAAKPALLLESWRSAAERVFNRWF